MLQIMWIYTRTYMYDHGHMRLRRDTRGASKSAIVIDWTPAPFTNMD